MPSEDAPDEEARVAADLLVERFMARLAAAERHAGAWAALERDVHNIGQREILATAEVTRRMTANHLVAMTGSLGGESSVARALQDLRQAVDSVDPSRFDLTGRRGRFLGILPRRNGVQEYLERYDESQDRIRELVAQLAAGRAELERNNSLVTAAQRSLGTEIDALRGYAFLAGRLAEALETDGPPEQMTPPVRHRQDLLFAARRRHQEVLTQLAVAVQGYAALEIVSNNNEELVRAVEAATNSTLAALRTGVMVAQALATKERMAQNLRQAQEATMDAVEAADAMREAADTVEGSTYASAVSIDALKRAWAEVFAAMTAIDRQRTSTAAAAAAAEREFGTSQPADR